ncbi:MAG: hypothetical protein M3395_01490 [Chloroflexota bacterium]|nr:hypothetical protein [Chloroflexota bacterium]MDQ3691647.1 hypothetical protein [Chloroflexota bacterium]
MHMRTRAIIVLGLTVMAIVAPSAALADGPVPIPAPEGFVELRERFEGKSGEQIAAMGYIAEPPVCISDPGLGGMGVHALNFALFSDQFQSGVLDEQNPPIVLLDATLQQVIGLEWEAADVGQGAPEVFGQPAILLPGHPGPPGTEVPHYMLHAYFRADGQVLFAPFDPEVICPQMPDSATEDLADDTIDASVSGPAIPVALLVGLMIALRLACQRRLATPNRPITRFRSSAD